MQEKKSLRNLLRSLDKADWFIIAGGLCLVLGLELAKPSSFFDPLMSWARQHSNMPRPLVMAPEEPAAANPEAAEPEGEMAAGANPNTACPEPAGDTLNLVPISSGTRVVLHDVREGRNQNARDLTKAAEKEGAFGALAMDVQGKFGRTWRYASRAEAARAALSLCAEEGGVGCKVVSEVLPDRDGEFQTCAWTLTPYQGAFNAKFKAVKAKSAVLALNRGGHAGFAEHDDVNLAAVTALAACTRDAEANADGIDSPCYVVRAMVEGRSVAVDKLKYRKRGETNFARKSPPDSATPEVASKPAPRSSTKQLKLGDDPSKLCIHNPAAVIRLVKLPKTSREVEADLSSQMRAAIRPQRGDLRAAGAFSAIATDGAGWARAVGYASRLDAARAALVKCRVKTGKTCKLALEILPSLPNDYLTCAWTFPPRLWDAYVLFKGKSSEGVTRAFAVSRNGSFGVGENSFPNIAADSALHHCVEMAKDKPDGINSPCYLIAALKDGEPYDLEDLVFRMRNESDYWQVATKDDVITPSRVSSIPTVPPIAPRSFAPVVFGPEARIELALAIPPGPAGAAYADWAAKPSYFGIFAANKAGDRYFATKGYSRMDVITRKAFRSCGEGCRIIAKMLPEAALTTPDVSQLTLSHDQSRSLRAASLAKGPRAFAYAPDGASAYGLGGSIDEAMAKALRFCTERLRPVSLGIPEYQCRVGQVWD